MNGTLRDATGSTAWLSLHVLAATGWSQFVLFFFCKNKLEAESCFHN